MTLEEFLSQIEARAKAATEGSWVGMIVPDDYSVHTFNLLSITDEKEIVPTASFIEHSRTDIPTLLAMLRLAIEQRDMYIDLNYEYQNQRIENKEDDNAELLKLAGGE